MDWKELNTTKEIDDTIYKLNIEINFENNSDLKKDLLRESLLILERVRKRHQMIQQEFPDFDSWKKSLEAELCKLGLTYIVHQDVEFQNKDSNTLIRRMIQHHHERNNL